MRDWWFAPASMNSGVMSWISWKVGIQPILQTTSKYSSSFVLNFEVTLLCSRWIIVTESFENNLHFDFIDCTVVSKTYVFCICLYFLVLCCYIWSIDKEYWNNVTTKELGILNKNIRISNFTKDYYINTSIKVPLSLFFTRGCAWSVWVFNQISEMNPGTPFYFRIQNCRKKLLTSQISFLH